MHHVLLTYITHKCYVKCMMGRWRLHSKTNIIDRNRTLIKMKNRCIIQRQQIYVDVLWDMISKGGCIHLKDIITWLQWITQALHETSSSNISISVYWQISDSWTRVTFDESWNISFLNKVIYYTVYGRLITPWSDHVINEIRSG